MNYLRIYNNIIEKRKIEKPIGYKERHHIIPYCICKSNEESNLIDLTAREHYICHLLLVKIHKNDKYYYKLLNAFIYMHCSSNNQKRYYNSRLYEYLKKDVSKLMRFLNTGTKNSNYGNIWMNNKKLQISKAVRKENVSEYLLNGWEIGRIIDWNVYKKNKIRKLISVLKIIIRNNKKRDIKQQKIIIRSKLRDRINKNRELYNFYYKEYNKFGWKIFKEKYNYTKTQQNFTNQLRRYVPDFKPQVRKKRGNKNLRNYYNYIN